MNSKQLNFFIAPEDIPSVYSFFNKHGIQYVRKTVDAINNVVSLGSFPYSDGEKYDQVYLTTETFKPYIRLDPEKEWPLTVDIFDSCVLQFTPERYYPESNKTLHRGVFYCTTTYFDGDGISVPKPEEFKKWVDNIFKLFKKEFFLRKYDERIKIYFSQKIITLLESNRGEIDPGWITLSIK